MGKITFERSCNYKNIIIRYKITFNYNVKWDTHIESIIKKNKISIFLYKMANIL